MKAIKTSIPGYRVNDYLLVINPHEELSLRIMKLRNDFAAKYKTEGDGWGKPQILLASFSQFALMEERMINRLRTVAMGFPPFLIDLKNFGSFPSHTIYINVASKASVQRLVKQIKTEAQRLLKMNDENKPHFIGDAHITIARKLKPWQYEKGWLEYSDTNFTGRLVASSMLLLKKPAEGLEHQQLRFKPIAKFEFQNLPVATKQGELFG